MAGSGKLVGVCVGSRRGAGKKNIGAGRLVENHGLEGDAHAGERKEISLVVLEEIRALNEQEGIDAGPGDFAENLTVEGLNLDRVQIGDRIRVGESAVIEIIELGKRPEDMTDDELRAAMREYGLAR